MQVKKKLTNLWVDANTIHCTVGKFRGSIVYVLSHLFIIQWYYISWGMSCPFNYTGVVGVKFREFNPTMKLTKFKHPQNLPTKWYEIYIIVAIYFRNVTF